MARQQFSHRISDEITVTGWNAHRYVADHQSPPHVSLDLRRFGSSDGYATQEDFATTLRMSPARARQVAAAMMAAADQAEQSPSTDDTIGDLEAP